MIRLKIEIIKRIEEHWKTIDSNNKLIRKKIRKYIKECNENELNEIENEVALELYYTKEELNDLAQ